MSERDDSGKFVKGNSGGPGRPKKEREERFYEITLTAVTFEDWKEIVKKAVAQAKRGDGVARKWLSDYLMGPPVQRQEVSGADGGAIEHEVKINDDAIIRKLFPELASGRAQGETDPAE